MTYSLYCVVNAIGVPYNDTFNTSSKESWRTHSWRDVVKDGYAQGSVQTKTLEKHEAYLRERGDRVVMAEINTNETVTVEYKETP